MPNISDKIADTLVLRQVQTLRAAEGVSNQLQALLRKAQGEIDTTLASRDFTRYSVVRMRNAQRQIRSILNEWAGESYALAREQISEIASLVTARTASDLNDIIKVDIFNPDVSARKMLAVLDDEVVAGQTMKKFWSKQPAEMAKAYTSIVRESTIAGETPAQLLKRVRNDPRIAAKPGSIRTMTRSTSMQTANTARMDMYGDNADLIKGVQWLSTLDTRTSPICQGLDGLTWTLKKEPIGHDKRFPGPTAHPNCRSTQVPLLRSLAELAGRNKGLAAQFDVAMSSRVRASMDGEVASSLSYSDWLRTKGDDFARMVLGAKRFDMWRGGTLDLRDMLDQRGNPLLAAELRTEFLESLPPASFSPPVIEPLPDEWLTDMSIGTDVVAQHLNSIIESPVDIFTKEQFKAQNAYVYTSYANINNFLRGKLSADSAKFAEASNYAAVLKTMFDVVPPLKNMGRVFRGLSDFKGSHIIGDVLEFSGFVSTTHDFDVVRDFVKKSFGNLDGSPVMFDIRLPKGTVGIVGQPDEAEFILNHLSRFRVIGIRYQEVRNDRIPVYELELIL